MNLADTILFRHLELPYIKLSEEDLESNNLHFKLNMPVLLSAYPSVATYSKYEFG
jgi:hypothetical protein